MKTAFTVYLEQVIDTLKWIRSRLPDDPVKAGWFVRGAAAVLDAVLYDGGLSVLATRLLDAAYEAREKGDLDTLRAELDDVIRILEVRLERIREEKREIIGRLAEQLFEYMKEREAAYRRAANAVRAEEG